MITFMTDCTCFVRQQKDAVKLWTMISSIICDDGAEGDLDEMQFRALNRYNVKKMGLTESLLTLYKRFKLLYENCSMLHIDGFVDEPFAARTFYSKLEAARHMHLYREKMTAVSRKMDV